jgi:ribonuclease HI
MDVVIYTDGGARGNPGPAAASFVITDLKNRMLSARAYFIGKATNNIAEYTALLKGLDAASQMQAKTVIIRSDSELVVRQINGEYKVKNSGLAEIYSQCMQLLAGFDSWRMEYIPREKNHRADALVNRALDAKSDIEEKPKAPANQKPLRLGILLSGSGRTMMNILENIKSGSLNAEIAVVVSSRSNTVGVEKAKAAGLNLKIVRTKDYPDVESFSNKIAEELMAAGAELVVQAGWLCLWQIPQNFENRVVNIHPALLPSFGASCSQSRIGRGMQG